MNLFLDRLCCILNVTFSEIRCNGQDDDCCTPDSPCEYLDGDCDANVDCDQGFLCGTDNCQGPGFDDTDDCCDFGILRQNKFFGTFVQCLDAM